MTETDEQHDEPEAPPGGQGKFLDEHHQRADMRLIMRALVNGWDIPDAAMRAIPAEVLMLFADRENDPRLRLRAAELISKLHGQNRADLHKLLPNAHRHDHRLTLTIDECRGTLAAIDARLAASGIGGVVIDEAAGGTGGDSSAAISG